MANQWDTEKINKWVAQGKLTREYITQRMDRMIRDGYALYESEEAVIMGIFEHACTHEGDSTTILTESGFISLLQSKAALPSTPEGIHGGKIIYSSIAYLSTIPFPKHPDARTSQLEGLSYNQLARGLIWASPGRYSYIIEEGNRSRQRTNADHRRLIFQSLASTTHAKPYHPEQARQMALKNAFDVDDPDFYHEFCSSNHDDDGDEIYHDLLDVLYSMQPVIDPRYATVHRDAFRATAKLLMEQNKVTSLHSLAIPTEDFIALARVLLALQFEPTDVKIDLSQYTTAAQTVCAAFCQDSNAEVISWPTFNHAFRDIMPYLFETFYRLLSCTFMDKSSIFDVFDATPPPTTSGNILTTPRQSQLVTFLAGSVYFGDLYCCYQYAGQNRPSIAAIINVLETVPDEAIMVISGTTKAGEYCIFGIFSPEPKADGPSIQTNVLPGIAKRERCSLFQLAPMQDTFRGVVGKPGWIVNSNAVSFGQDGGVEMIIKDGLLAEIRHEVVNVDEGRGAYEANVWRGNWTVEFEVAELEIWSEHDGQN
ncbi:hypothetical protein F5B20DRAFT_130270 [Whalleya microplaca]|nr:hypothetical protein F5B20DRAFT_130270 [Whalleya microplaca]